jgi:hypothetical protein
MSKLLSIAGLAAIVAALIAGPTFAAKGGHNATPSTSPCTVSGNVVSGTGLPTDQLINFMITEASGTWGFVLGFTHDGNWSVNVPAHNGPTTYAFVSRTYGPNGSKYNVFQTCSA